MARSRRTRSQFVSCLFEVDYLDGVPFIQNCHIRILGTPKDLRIDDDSTVADLTLMDVFDAADTMEI